MGVCIVVFFPPLYIDSPTCMVLYSCSATDFNRPFRFDFKKGKKWELKNFSNNKNKTKNSLIDRKKDKKKLGIELIHLSTCCTWKNNHYKLSQKTKHLTLCYAIGATRCRFVNQVRLIFFHEMALGRVLIERTSLDIHDISKERQKQKEKSCFVSVFRHSISTDAKKNLSRQRSKKVRTWLSMYIRLFIRACVWARKQWNESKQQHNNS